MVHPLYPRFKKLTIEDKGVIEKFTSIHPPYSDYYYFSLFSYNVDEQIEYSIFENNLVIKFQEYDGKGFFYSFLGKNKIPQTINELFRLSVKKGYPSLLKLISEHTLSHHGIERLNTQFHIEEDLNNFDYILSVDKLSEMGGKKLHQKRKYLNQFLRKYKNRYKVITTDVYDKVIQKELMKLINLWKAKKDKGDTNENEMIALKRTFNNAHHFNIKVDCVYIDGLLKGFSIYEIINRDYAIGSFQKADFHIEGIYPFLYYFMANNLKKLNCKYINIEQDLGLEGLRRSKKDYDPEYLKKYIISPKIFRYR
jgi:uncharacterized protein